jgi:aryl-alcohol dehydrogenase-like predicted oxidoreductase
MRYRVLGRTGIEVSVHCLGTMMFGFVGNPDHDDCVRIIHAALDQGINIVDTADMYSAGESETIVGKALQGRRDDVVLATKVHFPMGQGRNRGGNSRRWIVREVEESLRRLSTDWIDLYQVHRPDATTDIEETLSVLTDLVRQGKIRAFGCSTFRPSRSSRRTTSRSGAGCTGSGPSSRRTRCSPEGSRPTCSRSPSATAWAC